jgi:hypothetical protein
MDDSFQPGRYISICGHDTRDDLNGCHAWVLQRAVNESSQDAHSTAGRMSHFLLYVFYSAEEVFVSANFLSAASSLPCAISLLDITLAHRNHCRDTTHPAKFVPTANERFCITLTAMESFRLAALDSGFASHVASAMTLRLKDTLQSLDDAAWSSYVFAPYLSTLPYFLRGYGAS